VYCREGIKFIKRFVEEEIDYLKEKTKKIEKNQKVKKPYKLRPFLAFFLRDVHLKGALGEYFKEYHTRVQVEGDFAKAYCIRTVKKNLLMEKIIEEQVSSLNLDEKN
jgi:hypothetical protein